MQSEDDEAGHDEAVLHLNGEEVVETELSVFRVLDHRVELPVVVEGGVDLIAGDESGGDEGRQEDGKTGEDAARAGHPAPSGGFRFRGCDAGIQRFHEVLGRGIGWGAGIAESGNSAADPEGAGKAVRVVMGALKKS